MSLVSPGSGVRVPPGAFLFFLIHCVEEKNVETSLFLGLFLARPVGATEQRVRLLI